MNGVGGRNPVLESDVQGTVLPRQNQLLEWSMDTSGDFIQGPLDLAFLKGKTVCLNLDPGQLALLAEGSRLRTIYLDGGHILKVGSDPGQIPPESSLVFLATDCPVDLRWTFGSPIELPGPGIRHVIGNCQLNISNPSRFFAAFLGKAGPIDLENVSDDIEKAARQALTDYLAAACSDGPGFQACLQTTLMSLPAETLTEDLLGSGLTCTHLALYTAQPPVENENEGQEDAETAGHSWQLTHN